MSQKNSNVTIVNGLACRPILTKGMRKMIDTTLVPQMLIGGLNRYVENRIRPGSFLCAVLENNLVEAVAKADFDNIRLLPEIVQYCYENLPHNCWGSPKIVNEYLAKKE